MLLTSKHPCHNPSPLTLGSCAKNSSWYQVCACVSYGVHLVGLHVKYCFFIFCTAHLMMSWQQLESTRYYFWRRQMCSESTPYFWIYLEADVHGNMNGSGGAQSVTPFFVGFMLSLVSLNTSQPGWVQLLKAHSNWLWCVCVFFRGQCMPTPVSVFGSGSCTSLFRDTCWPTRTKLLNSYAPLPQH